MPKKSTTKGAERIPLQIKPDHELRAKLQGLAEKSGLSVNQVANYCFEKGLPIVERVLEQLKRADVAA